MEGLGFLIIILLVLYSFSILLTLLLLIRFTKTRLTGGIIAGTVVLSIILGIMLIYTDLVYEFSLHFVMIYLLSILMAYMISLAFPLEERKNHSEPQ